MNQKTIAELADTRTGYTFRKGEFRHRSKHYLGLHISDIHGATRVDTARLPPIKWESSAPPPALCPGDVVLAAKGKRNSVALYDGPSDKVVPSSQFLVLSIKSAMRHQLTPEYLCWVLNYYPTQQQVAEYQTGTNIRTISKRDLGDLRVPLPDRATQQRILTLQSLWEEEQRVLQALSKNNETMLCGMFQQLLNGATRT